jgi:energy-coupling factor transporter ATP-binding protein EcfA2
MNRIHTITVKNFKAFDDIYSFALNGKNLLIYGENGSGKSSLFWALYTFFQSSIKGKESTKYFTRENRENLLNIYVDGEDSWIDVSFTRDPAKFYRLSKDGLIPNEPSDPIVRETNLASDFITHRLLINFYNFRNSQEVDLFPVFRKDILPFLLTSEQTEFGPMYQEIVDGRPYRVTPSGAVRYATRRSRRYNAYLRQIEKFNAEMQRLVENINLKATPFLTQYFSGGIENTRLHLEYRPMQYAAVTEKRQYGGVESIYESKDTRELREPSIKLTVSQLVDGQYEPIERPQSFLNEAKLTAIALSIRFAVLDDKVKIESQILGLDDLLVSLDMSHRGKVLELVFDKYALSYQLVLLTHDRTFFSIAKEIALQKYQKEDWLFLEMYVHDGAEGHIVPKVLESEDFLAEAMRSMSEGHYPTAANALRKRAEEILERRLPSKVLLDEDGNKIGGLANHIIRAKAFLISLGKDTTLLERLKIYLRILLNPLSHKDDEAQMFRDELREVIGVLDGLEAFMDSLKFKEILPRTTRLTLLIAKNADVTNVYESVLKDDLYVVELADLSIGLAAANIETESCFEIRSGVRQSSHRLEKKKGGLRELYESMCKFENLPLAEDWLTSFKTEDGRSLNSFMVI